MANMLDFQFEGMRLKYIKKGSGRPLLLFHANGFSAGSYAPLTDHLANHGFHVHALNFMGHGGSDSTTDFHNWEFFGRQAAAFAEHLGYERFFAVGHSIGGASLLLATPSMEGRLVAGALLDPTVFSPLTSRFASLIPNPLAALAEKRRREFKDLRVVSRSFRMNPLFKQWHPASFEGYLETAFEATNAGYRLCLDQKLRRKYFEAFMRASGESFALSRNPF
ncbi:MAG TPA: alpha/beta hydrolase [Leptospiraceae bacterium]|nr:alpha/beta fold hydrolase [Leptospirales bacterium]HMX56543.1 alpha/beta hydrolase [Leptospiraceae bacterium]HMY46360.1 alpha/beta hydrolase [Leptospiraceae bacterium]HNE21549.1 alpha/beta hydrolase [Leptospiraceae bacterium]HNK99835.1 alpha/beta hydrolase [Leptospiraceae bacterium]